MFFPKEPAELTDKELEEEIESLENKMDYLSEGYALDGSKGSDFYFQSLRDNYPTMRDRLKELYKEEKKRSKEDTSINRK